MDSSLAASYTDHGVLLADGRIVGHLRRPTPDAVVSALANLGA
ncbi:hypothetical protein [Dactylosporangium vinaceum]|uniref:Uncharacterized protein n=1 Tax=Dactylosporangium vinaceum TaxID=53362 RepID=A0ABV5M964_9ACTN|nr:hypothetical protein [Dactylosporangium vinaceum]